ncbi:MAG: AraC family transcriptional regulator [Ruminococcaceae bacterium]|nr:AraC family transcriptional regulator [Oscillospiraceae bacterium]
MGYRIYTNDFVIEYNEEIIDRSVLWESHCHALFEMIAVVEGDVDIMLEGTGYRLKENQVIIIPPLCYHSITVNESRAYKRVTVLFDGDAIPEVLRKELAKRGAQTPVLLSAKVDKLKRICEEDRPEFFAPLAHSLMIQLLYDALQSSRNNVGEMDEFLQRVIVYIDAHLREKILLDDLARHTSRSKSSFCHLFEEKMNISPKQYILQKKLALADKLIGEGVPPTVVAMQIGYDNYSNFYRVYKKHIGKSPNSY